MSEHPHAGRIAAVAHLSAAYAQALCSEQALDDHGIVDDDYGVQALLQLGEAFHDLADHWMEPCEVDNVLQAVEETLADGEFASTGTTRMEIITAIVDTRQAAKADEHSVTEKHVEWPRACCDTEHGDPHERQCSEFDPTDDDLANRFGMEGGIAYTDGPDARDEHDPSL